jgi:hypothetical protein
MYQFISGDMTAKQFEEMYDSEWKAHCERKWENIKSGNYFTSEEYIPADINEIVNYIFTSTDCFTEDEDAIRDDPGFNISGEQMRQEVQQAYDAIMAILNKS